MLSLEQLQDGLVIPIDKPRQWTSFQVVNKIKAVVRNTYGLKKFKIGHAGTLDPLATGLLLVCIGKATKTIPQLQDGDKVYIGTLILGATTPCYDLERPIDQYYPYEHITPELLSATARQFVGVINQVPPMFSAVKIAGQRAYEYARLDDPAVTIQPKPVTVYSFEITDFRMGAQRQVTELLSDQVTELSAHSATQPPSQPVTQSLSHLATQPPTPSATHHLYQNPLGTIPPHLPQADFRIHCGKGTYIRSLARDLGLALGSGAFLGALRRERVGDYTVDCAITPDQVESYFSQG